jgi:hypothetical protein
MTSTISHMTQGHASPPPPNTATAHPPHAAAVSTRRRRVRCRPDVVRCASTPPSFAARRLRRRSLHAAARSRTARPSARRRRLRCRPGVVRCASSPPSPPSFAACRRPSPPTPVNQKNTPSTTTFVRSACPLNINYAIVFKFWIFREVPRVVVHNTFYDSV